MTNSGSAMRQRHRRTFGSAWCAGLALFCLLHALPAGAQFPKVPVAGGCQWFDDSDSPVPPEMFYPGSNDTMGACASTCFAAQSPPLTENFWGVRTGCDAWTYQPLSPGMYVNGKPTAGLCWLHHWPDRLRPSVMARG